MLQNFVKAKVYLKRSRKFFDKELGANWTINLDLDTLEAKNEWATIEELLRVLPFHSSRYKDVLQMCKANPKEVSLAELSSATRFIIAFCFLQIKGTLPMTYQYLTLVMFQRAKLNN